MTAHDVGLNEIIVRIWAPDALRELSTFNQRSCIIRVLRLLRKLDVI